MSELTSLLKEMVYKNASDLHLKPGSPPVFRIDGVLTPQSTSPLTPQDTERMAFEILGERRGAFEKRREIDFAYSLPGLARFRVNIFYQRKSIEISLRLVPINVRSFEELNLPPEPLQKLCSLSRGLILVTGVAGSGKTTTLAAMVEWINTHRRCHIITIEDPIEYLHRDKLSIISQRELGEDTLSYAEALRHIVRQDPDVILIGELRDEETVRRAINIAETGHLVLSTLHTTDALQTVNRLINFFPPYQQKQIRHELAFILAGVISLRLLPRKEGKGRVPAVEIMVSTPTIKEYIMDEDKTHNIPTAISQGRVTYGMRTFDQSLFELYEKGLISYEVALSQATSPTDLQIWLRKKGLLLDEEKNLSGEGGEGGR